MEKCRGRSIAILTGALALTIAADTPPTEAQQSGQTAAMLGDTSLRQRVEGLGLAYLPGPSPAWHVAGAEPRARSLQSLLAEQGDFFRERFGVDIAVGVAVLDPSAWSRLAPNVPYGLPSVSGQPYTAIMPASWDDVRWLLFPDRSRADPALLREADRRGLDWDQALRSGADLIVTHEFGHTLVHQLDLDPRSFWFGEFLATYAGYAFVMERRPELALPNRLFSLSVANGPHPQTSLRYLDENYQALALGDPANYGWYQGRIFERVEQVYAEEGLGFITEIRAAFAAGAPMNHDQVLNRLEQISPGWKAWADAMSAAGSPPPS